MGSMDQVHRVGPWTQPKMGIHRPGIDVLSFPISISPHKMQSYLHLFTAASWELFFVTFLSQLSSKHLTCY